MPLVRLNPTLLALHGRLGDRVYKTYGDGRVLVTRVPDFAGYIPTAAQRTQRDRMRAATAYAQRVYADPAAKAVYLAAAQKLGRCAFRLAISDYLAGRVRVPEAALIPAPPPPGALGTCHLIGDKLPPLFPWRDGRRAGRHNSSPVACASPGRPRFQRRAHRERRENSRDRAPRSGPARSVPA